MFKIIKFGYKVLWISFFVGDICNVDNFVVFEIV